MGTDSLKLLTAELAAAAIAGGLVVTLIFSSVNKGTTGHFKPWADKKAGSAARIMENKVLFAVARAGFGAFKIEGFGVERGKVVESKGRSVTFAQISGIKKDTLSVEEKKVFCKALAEFNRRYNGLVDAFASFEKKGDAGR